MFEIPSFGDWLSKHDLFWQVQFIAVLKIVPLLVVVYGYTLSLTFGINKETAIVTPLIIGVLMFFSIQTWEFNNKDRAVRRIPINFIIRYNKTKAPMEVNVIKNHFVNFENYENNTFSYFVSLEKPFLDIMNNEEVSYFLLNAKYSWDIIMQKVDDCIIAYNGSVFDGPAALIVVDWAMDFKSVTKQDEGYNVVPFRVFNLAWCIEDGDNFQKAVGAVSPDGEIQTIKDGLKHFDTNNSIKTLMELNDQKSLNQALSEKMKTSGEQIVEYIDTFIDNDRFVRKPNVLINWRNPKVRLALIVGAVLLGAVAYWFLYVRKV